MPSIVGKCAAAVLGDPAGDAMPERHAKGLDLVGFRAERNLEDQFIAFDDQNGRRFGSKSVLNALQGGDEHGVEVQRRGQVDTDLMQQLQRGELLIHGAEQASILNGDGRVAPQSSQ